MFYAEIVDNVVQQYPITLMQVRTMYPNVSWPDEPSDNDLLSKNLYVVYETAAPTPTRNQILTEGTPTYNEILSKWEQNWILADEALAAAKEAEKAHLAEIRWEHETGGTTWDYDGQGTMVAIVTDAPSITKIGDAYTLAKDGYWVDGKKWKFSDGVFRPMTAAQVMSMALTCAMHVQYCFEREAVLSAQIDAATTIQEIENWTWEE